MIAALSPHRPDPRCFGPSCPLRLDPAGAAVPDATVVIKTPSTGLTRSNVSGADGTFIFNSVVPATYDLTITAKSDFKTYAQTNIDITPTERRDLGNISLALGSLTEEVSVTATATPGADGFEPDIG